MLVYLIVLALLTVGENDGILQSASVTEWERVLICSVWLRVGESTGML